MTSTNPSTGTAYYIDTGWVFCRNGLGLLACLVAMAPLLTAGNLGFFFIAFGGAAALGAVYLTADLVKTFLNRGRPFIILGPTHFMMGTPQTAVAYDEVSRFGFEPGGLAGNMAGFALFPNPGEKFAEIKRGWPVFNSKNRLVCRTSRIKTGADDFYADFGQKLLAAGAVPAQSEVLFEEQKEQRSNELWNFFYLGALVTLLVAAEIFGLSIFWEGLPGSTVLSAVWTALVSFILFPAMLVGAAVSGLRLLIGVLGLGRFAEGYMAKTGPVKKFFWGATLGALLGLVILCLIFAAI